MILWADGFDHYGSGGGGQTQMLDGAYAACSTGPDNTEARTGTYSFPISFNNGNFRRVFGSPLQDCGIAQAIYVTRLPNLNQSIGLVSFRDSANLCQIQIELQTTGVVAVWRGDSTDNFGVLLGQSTDLVAAASWNHLETKVHFAGGTSGTVEIRLNGVTIVNLSGISTVNATSPATGELSASQMTCAAYRNETSATMYIDDLILWDTAGSLNNNFIGDQKVFTDMPNADTADVDWTPLSGSNRYGMIDEVPADGDTSYDACSTVGDKMGVTFPALDALIDHVAAIVFVAKTKKTDAGTCNLQVSAESSGDTAAGADNAITTAYSYRLDVFETDPHTSAPWVAADAGAAAMVIERTA